MQTWKSVAGIAGVITVALLAMGCEGGGKKESFNVNIAYVLEPTEKLPEGLNSLAVLDAGTTIEGGEDADREKKWATIAADMMERMVQDAASKYGKNLTVAKRRDTTKVLAEKDMKAAGLVDGNTAAQAAKLLDVQALITSKLNIRVEVKKSKKSTVDITSVAAAAGRHWGGGGGTMHAREADAISRNMTLQTAFSMMDAATGQAMFQYTPSPFRKVDQKKPGPVFGRSAGEADLDPVDEYIGELVEKGVREFVSMFLPCEMDYSYTIHSGKSKASAAGIAMMRSEEYETAMQHFKTAITEDPEDHRSVFAMGITCELMKDWESALKYYKQACGMQGVDKEDMDQYLAAKNRVAAHKDRIRKADAKASK